MSRDERDSGGQTETTFIGLGTSNPEHPRTPESSRTDHKTTSKCQATLRFQRPQQRTVVLKQPGTGTQGASGVSEPALSEGSFGVTSKEADARDICK